jgi:hypothetical protein
MFMIFFIYEVNLRKITSNIKFFRYVRLVKRPRYLDLMLGIQTLINELKDDRDALDTAPRTSLSETIPTIFSPSITTS